MKSQRLPDTEFEIMSYIWDREPPVTTTMVMEESFVEHYHRNSFKSLLTALESERLTESDLDELSRWLERQKGGGHS